MIVVMQGLTIDAQYHRERNAVAVRDSDAFHCAGYFLFYHAWLTHLHRCGMHEICCVGSLFHIFNLDIRFNLTKLNDFCYKLLTYIFRKIVDVGVKPFSEFYFHVAAIRRKDMDLSSFIDSVAEIFAEAVDVAGLFDGYHLALLSERWKVAAPNDVVDSYFSTEQYLLA